MRSIGWRPSSRPHAAHDDTSQAWAVSVASRSAISTAWPRPLRSRSWRPTRAAKAACDAGVELGLRAGHPDRLAVGRAGEVRGSRPSPTSRGRCSPTRRTGRSGRTATGRRATVASGRPVDGDGRATATTRRSARRRPRRATPSTSASSPGRPTACRRRGGRTARGARSGAAARRFEHHDLGAEVGQQLARERPRHRRREVEHEHAVECGRRHGARCSTVASRQRKRPWLHRLPSSSPCPTRVAASGWSKRLLKWVVGSPHATGSDRCCGRWRPESLRSSA